MTLLKTLAAAALLATGLAPAVQAQVQSFSTPPQGSVWNTMASVISGEARKSAGMRLVVQPYGGNAQMMQAVNEALAEFSLNDVNDVITAVQGSGDYTAAMPNLRIVARINPFPVGLYVKESSGLTSVADLEGRSVPSGWDAFPIARSHISAILAAGGIGWEDVDQVPVPELIRGSDDMASGRVDSAFFAVGGPKVAEVDASVGGVRFLGITANDETLAKIRKVRPAFYFSEVTLKTGPRWRGRADDVRDLGQRSRRRRACVRRAGAIATGGAVRRARGHRRCLSAAQCTQPRDSF